VKSAKRRGNGEGSIYRRGSDNLWVAALSYIDDNGKRRQRVIASGRRRSDVAARLEDARRRLSADEPVKDARATVAMFVEDWIRKALPASGGSRPRSRTTPSLPART
jgi:hypothetical protein